MISQTQHLSYPSKNEVTHRNLPRVPTIITKSRSRTPNKMSSAESESQNLPRQRQLSAVVTITSLVSTLWTRIDLKGRMYHCYTIKVRLSKNIIFAPMINKIIWLFHLPAKNNNMVVAAWITCNNLYFIQLLNLLIILHLF